MDTVGSRLRFRRKQKKLTQRDVAEWAGVSASAVTQWESDLTKLSGENLILVCKCLQCSPEFLVQAISKMALTSTLCLPERFHSYHGCKLVIGRK